MKAIIKIFPLLLILILTSCGIEEVPGIDSCTWKMETVSISVNGSILYYGSQEELADIYPNAEPLQLLCNADDGTISISDTVNKKSYTGTYQLTDTDMETKQYKIVFGEVDGYAITGSTEYLNKESEKTLIITVGDYTIYFYEMK